MRLDLSQIIEIPGGSVPFSCVLDTGDLDFEQVKAYRSAPHAEGCVRNTAGILELTGTIEAAMKCVCDRCGGEYDTVKETALSALLSEDDSEEDDPDVFPLEGDSIDLTEILRTLFILDMDLIQKKLLAEVADLHGIPEGAYNIRADGKLAGRNTTANIDIVTKTDKPGIDIIIKPGTKNESVHIPVIIEQTGLNDLVYNDFYVGEDCDVTIVAGCGISNCGGKESRHDGIHSFHVAKNARVRYVEKHYGEGTGSGGRVMNPTTLVELDEGAYMEMETTQIKGINDTLRKTGGKLAAGASLVIREKIMVVFPAPVCPTMATFWPGFIRALKFLMTSFSGS